MATNLALLALVLGVASLFLPTMQGPGAEVTIGVLVGDVKDILGVLAMGPSSLAALLGATLGRQRFGRGLGLVHVVLGGLGLFMCAMILQDVDVDSGKYQAGMGTYLATATGALVVLAGLIGLVRPDPK